MTLKLKITLGALIVLAVFILFLIKGSIPSQSSSSESKSNTISQNTKPNANPATSDWDADGLSDMDESIYGTDPFNPDTDQDGFLDGEEVLTGYDPTIPEQDKIGVTNNITQTFAEGLVAGVYFGNLQPGGEETAIYDEELDFVSSTTLTEALSLLRTPEYLPLMIVEDTSENISTYNADIERILSSKEFSTAYQTQDDALIQGIIFFTEGREEDAIYIFERFADIFSETATAMEEVRVPESFTKFHTNFVIYVKNISLNYQALAGTPEDPLLAQVAMSELVRNLENLQTSIVEDLSALIDSAQK